MLRLTKGTTSTVVVTLNEKKTLSNPYYLFVFEHIETNRIVKFVVNSADDISIYQDRYNEFEIGANKFEMSPVGFYNYTIYEQESNTNTVIGNAGSKVEKGKLKLSSATPFTFTEYEKEISYKAYAG